LDVIATAAAAKLTINDLADIDLSYSPPIGTPNDAINMSAYVAENRQSGFSPSITASELDTFIVGKNPVFIDVRDVFAFQKSHIQGALNIPLELLSNQLATIPTHRPVIVYDETGKKGHQALRTLVGAGFTDVINVSGGHISLQRYARAMGFKNIELNLLPLTSKSVGKEEITVEKAVKEENKESNLKEIKTDFQLVIDVRTVPEFRTGAYPGALNIPLDELMVRRNEIGNDLNRDIVVYCASGGRSAYAQRQLQQLGYTNVKNGGGISSMMAALNKPSASAAKPLIVDVRTPVEFAGGAYPGAVNIQLDELPRRINELGDKSREITVYCASGARSAYAERMLAQLGFDNVKNGGGLMHMMQKQR